ncbi:unnamed protein product, partial [Discosporangium mesarthrocarpum]
MKLSCGVKALTLLAWAGNMKAVFAGGRLDGSSSVPSKRGSPPSPVRFFTPASWAFIIWAPIMIGELIFVLYQLLPLPEIKGSWWLADVSPWFAGAMFFQ